jgi:hypothetical protein
MRIGSRDVPLPAIGAAAAALIAIIVVAVVVVASGGGDDDDGDGDSATADRTVAANRTSVSQSRTRIPLTSTAIAEARATAIAQGTPEDAFDEANPTPVPPTPAVGGPDTGPGLGTPVPGETPGPGTATPLPGETNTPAPTATNVPPGVIGDVTMDTNRGTPDIDHSPVNAAIGASFQVGVNIYQPSGAYQGYQYAVVWDDSGVLDFVSEQRLEPQGMTLCTDITPDSAETTFPGREGIYGGCLSAEGNVTHTGEVAVLNLRCDGPGTVRVRLLALGGGEPFATSLLGPGGSEIPTEVDNGFDVVCA